MQAAGLSDRITLREQDVATLDDEQAYDCVWFPTFFITEAVLTAAIPCVLRALRPGGWIVLVRLAPPPDPLAEAVNTLRTIRAGGAILDPTQLSAALENAGCTDIRVISPPPPPTPLAYVSGQRPK